jgi:uncharacterized protein YbaR (Trm112 family)
MPADSSRSFAFDQSVVSQLACPACLGALRMEEGKLLCTECGRAYPIVDGIPVLIAGRENSRNE